MNDREMPTTHVSSEQPSIGEQWQLFQEFLQAREGIRGPEEARENMQRLLAGHPALLERALALDYTDETKRAQLAAEIKDALGPEKFAQFLEETSFVAALEPLRPRTQTSSHSSHEEPVFGIPTHLLYGKS